MRKFFYRLFFTKDDSLDLNYVTFIGLVVLFGYLVVKGIPVSAEGWEVFKWVFITLALMSAPVWLVTLAAETYSKKHKDGSDAEG